MKPLYSLFLLQLICAWYWAQALPHYLQDTFQTTTYHHEAEEQLFHTTQRWLDAKSITSSCSGCISVLRLIKSLSYTSESILIRTLTNVCKRTKRVSPEVCRGIMEEQIPIARKVIKTMSVAGRDGHLFCAAVANSCPYPDLEPWNVTFPRPKPHHIKKLEPSGESMTVLQLSDWHVDPNYEADADAVCDKPICCRRSNTNYSNVTKPASKWGEYTCDPPMTLVESMLEFIPTVEKDIQFGIMTGDVPPHEIWSTLPYVKTQRIHESTYALLHHYFDSKDKINAILYPAVGNHESAPTNNFPLMSSSIPLDKEREYLNLDWLYRSLAQSWHEWLSDKPSFSVETRTGSYVTRPLPGLKLISLNTNFCYTLNWWLYERPMNLDPNGILIWLVEHLQEAEDAGERVWIIGHIAPGDTTCFHDYANYYYQIIERYAPHVIAAQFFGHTHKDELQIFYRDGQQTAEDAISVGYVAPSITPYVNVNPSFRVYKVDKKTFEIVDSITYMANLDQAKNWTDAPNWHIEYSAREAFQLSSSPLNATDPLSPSWWHNVTEEMEVNDTMFEKYWRQRFRSPPRMPECDDECRSNTICGMRAGKSELRCDYDPDIFFRHGRTSSYAEVHPCGWNLEAKHT